MTPPRGDLTGLVPYDLLVRVIAQRVSRASVQVAGETVGAIATGLLALVGVAASDTEADASLMAGKLAGLRIFADAQGQMNLSVMDVGGAVLLVSQFTLYGRVARGRRPSFTAAAPPEVAEPLIATIARLLGEKGISVAQGKFGARMSVELVNEGPVTIIVETDAGRLI